MKWDGIQVIEANLKKLIRCGIKSILIYLKQSFETVRKVYNRILNVIFYIKDVSLIEMQYASEIYDQTLVEV